jgi:hypothetical protein
VNEKFREVLERIESVTEIKTMTELGRVVGSSQQYVSKKSREGEFPPAWAFEVAKKYGISTDWIMTGEGPKRINQDVEINPLLIDVNEWLNEEEKQKDSNFCNLFKQQMIRAFFDYERWIQKREEAEGGGNNFPASKVA